MILFELVYPLKTHMEKRERLNELRKGKLPENLLESYKGISELILRMTNSNPSKRPSARMVLSSLEFENEEISSEKSPKRNRFFSDDVKDNRFKDFEIVEFGPVIAKNMRLVIPANMKTVTNSYQIVESTFAFSVQEMVYEDDFVQTNFNGLLGNVNNEDSWEHIGNKIIDEKVII
jgi:hypothetical protein